MKLNLRGRPSTDAGKRQDWIDCILGASLMCAEIVWLLFLSNEALRVGPEFSLVVVLFGMGLIVLAYGVMLSREWAYRATMIAFGFSCLPTLLAFAAFPSLPTTVFAISTVGVTFYSYWRLERGPGFPNRGRRYGSMRSKRQ